MVDDLATFIAVPRAGFFRRACYVVGRRLGWAWLASRGVRWLRLEIQIDGEWWRG